LNVEQKRTVCILEDDAVVRGALVALLRSRDYYADCFCSAEELLQAGFQRTWACLIVDLRLPEMTGIELLKRLAEDGFEIPCVVISGHGDSESLAQLSQFERVCFLAKPFDPSEFLSVVSDAVCQSHGRQHVRAQTRDPHLDQSKRRF